MKVKQPLFGSIVRIVIMVASLVLAIVFLQATHYSVQQHSQLNKAVNAKERAKSTVRNYEQLTKQFQEFAALNEQRNDVRDSIRKSHLQRSQWSVRDLELHSVSMEREQVQGYLTGVSSRSGYFFVPSSFMLKVPLAEDDIFSWSKGDSLNLQVTLNGQYYIRREK
jgi:hypothetical protein